MKQANHYFRLPVGDEMRDLRGVSLDAIGLYDWIRIYTFDNEPSGFLVDHLHRPWPADLKRLADTIGEKNARVQNLYAELRQHRLIQSVSEFTVFLTRQADRQKRSAKKRDAFVEMVADVWPSSPMDINDVHLVPMIVNQLLETRYGQRCQTTKPAAPTLAFDLLHQGGTPPGTPRGVPENEEVVDHLVPPQSHSQSQRHSHRLEESERETPAAPSAVEIGGDDSRLPSPARYDWLIEQHRKFHDRADVLGMMASDREGYELAFERELGYTPTGFEILRSLWNSRHRVSACVARWPRDRARVVVSRVMAQLPLPLGGRA